MKEANPKDYILYDTIGQSRKDQTRARGRGRGRLQRNITRENFKKMGLFSVMTVKVVTQIYACIKTHRPVQQNKIHFIV